MIRLLNAFFWLELHLARQYRWALLTQSLQFIVFLLIFSRLSFEQIGETTKGIPYVQFVLTGLAYQTAYESILNGPTSRLHELQISGQLQVVLSSPYPRWMVLLASGSVSALAGFARAFLALVAGTWLFDLSIHVESWPALMATVAFTIFLSGSLAIINVAGSLLWPRVNLTSFFSSILLGLLSGVFVPAHQLPGFLKPLSDANPLRWGLDLFRFSLGQTNSVTPDGTSGAFAVLLILSAAAVWLFKKADRALVRDNRYQLF